MPLHRALYVSDAVAGAGSTLLSIVEILGASERNNRRDHVTGVLLCHEGRFLQVVEGARGDLDRLFNRLRLDPRHTNIRLLADHPVGSRLFGDWTMAQVLITPDLARLMAASTLSDIAPDRAEALLHAASQALPATV